MTLISPTHDLPLKASFTTSRRGLSPAGVTRLETLQEPVVEGTKTTPSFRGRVRRAPAGLGAGAASRLG